MGNGASATARTGGGLFKRERWYAGTEQGERVYFTPADFDSVATDLSSELIDEVSGVEDAYDRLVMSFGRNRFNNPEVISGWQNYVNGITQQYINGYEYYENFYNGMTSAGKESFRERVADALEDEVLRRMD